MADMQSRPSNSPRLSSKGDNEAEDIQETLSGKEVEKVSKHGPKPSLKKDSTHADIAKSAQVTEKDDDDIADDGVATDADDDAAEGDDCSTYDFGVRVRTSTSRNITRH